MKLSDAKARRNEGARESGRRDCRGRHGPARKPAEIARRREGRRQETDHRRDDDRVQGRRHQGLDAARQRHPARSRVGPARRQGAQQECRPAAGLRAQRLRQHATRPPARPAAARFREAHRGLGRRRGQDPDLLHAVRRPRRSTTSSTPSSSASAPSARLTDSVLPGIRGLRSQGRRRERAWSSPKSSPRS